MTPEQKIKREILLRAQADPDLADITKDGITDETIDEQYGQLCDRDANHDYESEFRTGEVETELPSEYSRHYESKSVAAKCRDGSWVGWTYWYGGGKHGEPGAIEWMADAYDLDVTETEKLVVVREFKKREAQA